MAYYNNDVESGIRKDRYKEIIEAVKAATNVKVLLDMYNLDYKSTRNDESFRLVCPIHPGADRKDGFLFDNESKSYRCFTKECHGDVITFIQEMDRCTFRDAVLKLAEINNIEIDNWSNSDVYRSKYERFSERAKEFGRIIHERKYELENGGNINRDTSELLRYVRLPDYCSEESRRGLDKETIDEFDVRLGRMVEDPYKHLRIIVPIHDEYGNYIGQVGRTWYSVDRGKYWYVPTGLGKSKFVFNGNRAKDHVMEYDDEKATIFVCEGAFDVLKLWKIGIKSAVAIFGSEPSEDQLRIVNKFADRFILCFDDDVAGVKATKHFNTMVSEKKIGAEIKIMKIPIGKKDVGDMTGYDIRKALEDLMSYTDWLKRLKNRIDLN